MSTELALRGATLPEKIDYAEHLAHAGLLPDVYRRQPANVLYAIEYGETIGIGTMAAITGVHVIKGKPTASSALISALVRRAGHKLRITGNDQAAVAIVLRADDPEFEYRSEWTLDRAVTAGLCELRNGRPWARDKDGKPTSWEKYPAAMLKARAITEVARDACEEVLFGLHYTPEELGANVDAEGIPVEQPLRQAVFHTIDPNLGAEAEYAEVVGEDTAPATEWNTATGAPLPPPAPTVPTVTGEQLGELARLLKQKRGAVNGDRNRIISELVQRPVADVQTLSQAEARSIIETLTAEPDQASPTPDAAPAGPAPVGTPDNPAVTAAQQKALHAVLRKAGYGDRAKGLELLGRYVGRQLESSERLSKAEASTIINKLSNGELPPPADVPEPPGPNANGGLSEFDALDQMILDVTSDEARAEVEQAITVELGRGTITATGAGVLRRRLADHVAARKTGALS